MPDFLICLDKRVLTFIYQVSHTNSFSGKNCKKVSSKHLNELSIQYNPVFWTGHAHSNKMNLEGISSWDNLKLVCEKVSLG